MPLPTASPLTRVGQARRSPGRGPHAAVSLRFDRGTILVEGPPGVLERVAALGLTELLADPRVGALRAPAHRDAAVRRALHLAQIPCQVRGAPPLQLIDALRRPPLRSYQQEALDSWLINGCRGVVVLPTGAGKTRVAIAALARLCRSALVLVPTRVLLNQWLAELQRCYRGPIGVLGDGRRSVEPLTVCTFESAYRRMDDHGDRFEVVVVDEAHHFGSGARAEALEMCTAARRLGLTATPPDSVAATARLGQLVGPVVCHYAVSDLAGEHLAPFDRIRLFVELDEDERRAYLAAREPFNVAYARFRQAGGWSYAEFARLAGRSTFGRRALAGFIEARRLVSNARVKLQLVARLLARHRSDRTLIFTADNHAAYAVSRTLLIPAVTCDIKRRERDEVLGWLREGKVRAVVSSRVLNEGIDLPEARIGVIVGGTLGAREHVQRVGRLLRPLAGKRAVVYELVARDTYEVQSAERRQRDLVA